MAHLKIDAPEALDVLAKVEGADWKKKQLNDPKNPFGFFAYLEAYQWLKANPEWSDIAPAEVLGANLVEGVEKGGDGVIYGNGGYSRYFVTSKGTLVLLAWSTYAERLGLARSLNIAISGELDPDD